MLSNKYGLSLDIFLSCKTFISYKYKTTAINKSVETDLIFVFQNCTQEVVELHQLSWENPKNLGISKRSHGVYTQLNKFKLWLYTIYLQSFCFAIAFIKIIKMVDIIFSIHRNKYSIAVATNCYKTCNKK